MDMQLAATRTIKAERECIPVSVMFDTESVTECDTCFYHCNFSPLSPHLLPLNSK